MTATYAVNITLGRGEKNTKYCKNIAVMDLVR
jgi:hypothetical protein